MDSGDEYFFHNFIGNSDDSPSGEEEILIAALVVHDHISRQLPIFRGLILGHTPALNHNRESGHYQFWQDYSSPQTRSSNTPYSGAAS
mgnify:CR=1 FL=1